MEAALAAGVHYTDTTGEQDWLMTCDEEYGAEFAAAGLLLAPGIAQMYTTGEIAAQLCLEKPGLDTLDIAVFWGGSPTIASTETILVNAAPSKAALPGAEPVRRSSTRGRAWCRSSCPGSTSSPCPCPGAARRTRSGSSATRAWPTARRRAVSSTRALMHGVPQIVAAALEATKDMNADDRRRAHRDRPSGDEPDAAAGEPARQQVPGLRPRLRSAGPRALS